MDEDYDLYGGTPPHEDSDTSHDAAESMRPHVKRMALTVYQALARHGKNGATCDELEVELDMRHQTCSARVRELELKGLVYDSGTRRRTRSGRTAMVWVVRQRRVARAH